jgi:hypothetical protein
MHPIGPPLAIVALDHHACHGRPLRRLTIDIPTEADLDVVVPDYRVHFALFVKRVRTLLEAEDFGKEPCDRLKVVRRKRDLGDSATEHGLMRDNEEDFMRSAPATAIFGGRRRSRSA